MTTQIATIIPEHLHAAQHGVHWHPTDRGRRHPLVWHGTADRAHTLEQVWELPQTGASPGKS